jgi:hypothetical protein
MSRCRGSSDRPLRLMGEDDCQNKTLLDPPMLLAPVKKRVYLSMFRIARLSLPLRWICGGSRGTSSKNLLRGMSNRYIGIYARFLTGANSMQLGTTENGDKRQGT